MKDVRHVKLEFDPNLYEVIREAAYQARIPIRRWCAEVVARTARQTVVTPPPPTNPRPPAAAKSIAELFDKLDEEGVTP